MKSSGVNARLPAFGATVWREGGRALQRSCKRRNSALAKSRSVKAIFSCGIASEPPVSLVESEPQDESGAIEADVEVAPVASSGTRSAALE